jgi:sulfite exporter TauE/SafE
VQGHASELRAWGTYAVYFVGKTLAYMGRGLIYGFLGMQLALVGFQQSVSIVAGAVMLLVAVLMILNSKYVHQSWFGNRIGNFTARVMGKIIESKSPFKPLGIGLANGILPCGLVFIGLAGAVTAGSAAKGALFMAAFGLGTMPVLFSFMALTHKISWRFRFALQRATPYLVGIVGLLLIVRGMDLGIPFLSPALGNTTGAAIPCHP